MPGTKGDLIPLLTLPDMFGGKGKERTRHGSTQGFAGRLSGAVMRPKLWKLKCSVSQTLLENKLIIAEPISNQDGQILPLVAAFWCESSCQELHGVTWSACIRFQGTLECVAEAELLLCLWIHFNPWLFQGGLKVCRIMYLFLSACFYA